jgi:nicotinate-nucleotide adenylyltransferase
MRIALFGGTFDPPHRGHIAIARAAADSFSLDKILFAPAGKQPLKTTAPGADFNDRLAMVQIATENSGPRFPVSSIFVSSDIDKPHTDGSANYTVDTLTALKAAHPGDEIFCITGADAFLDIHHWREPNRLFELADWIVVSRPGLSLADLSPLALTPQQLTRVHLLQGIAEDVSATKLREALRNGQNVDADLAPGVGNYIRTHHLYTASK